MCVIIYKKNEAITREELSQAFITNPDGYGWITPSEFKPHRGKTLATLLNSAPPAGAVVWCRISTGGATLQPVEIKLKDRTVFLFHNGIVGKSSGNKSDTQLLADTCKGITFNDLKSICDYLHKKTASKFAIIQKDKEPIFYGGKRDGDDWRSNENHLIQQTQTALKYYRNYRGEYDY